MPAVPIRTYTGNWLNPAVYPDTAKTDAVRFAPGSYVAGLVAGQQTADLTAAADVQTLTVVGTGGTFTLTFGSGTTPSLAYNATAAAVKAALEALPDIGVGNVNTSGGPGATAPIVITFQGALLNLPQPAILVTSAVTGGAGASIAHTTPGRQAGGSWVAYNDAGTLGETVAKGLLKFPLTVDSAGYHYAGGWEFGRRELTAPIYVAGYFFTKDLTGLDAAAIADLGRIVEGSAALLTNPGTILKIN